MASSASASLSSMNSKIRFPDVKKIQHAYERNRNKTESSFRYEIEQKLSDAHFVSTLREMLNDSM